MKKILLQILFSGLVAFNAMAVNYWNHELWNGLMVSDVYATMPSLSGHELLGTDDVTGNSIDLSFSVDLSWYNLRRRGSSTWVQATALIESFDYSYRVGYSTSQGGSITWFYSSPTTGSITDIPMETPEQPMSNYSFSSRQQNYRFHRECSIDISNLQYNRKYYMVVELSVKPSRIVDTAGGSTTTAAQDGVPLEESYARTQTIRLWKSATGVDVWFRRVIAGNPHISYDMGVNPRYRTGVYERNVVYNHPKAVVAVCLDTTMMPSQKVINNVTYYPVTMCCAGLGTETPISESYQFKYPSGCWCKNGDGVDNKDVLYVQDMSDEYGYLKSIGASQLPNRFRNRRLILCTKEPGMLYDNAIVSLHDESLVTSSGTSNNIDGKYWVEWHYALNDIVGESGGSSAVGTTFSIRNTTAYLTSSVRNSVVNDPALYRLGYEFYGPSYGFKWFSTRADDFYYPKSENTLSFEVVPQAVFPQLSTDETAVKRHCVASASDSVLTESDIIHLSGRKIDCGIYSPSIYGAEYDWEVSFDGRNWKSIRSEAFSGYIVNVLDLPFALVVNDETDIIVNSSILQSKERVYFRQSAILRTFSDALSSELYNYADDDGRFYIKVDASDYLTYIPFSQLSLQNFTAYSMPEVQYVCEGDQPAQTRLHFDITSGGLIGRDELEEMRDVVGFHVCRVSDSGEEEFLASGNTYDIEYSGDTMHLRAVIELCHDRMYKDFHIYPNPVEEIMLSDISSSARIATLDEANKTITLLSIAGSDVDITVGGANIGRSEFTFRRVVPGEYTLWRSFDSENSTVLQFDGSSATACTCYIRKSSRITGCFSDSVKVIIRYFDGISNNNIYFSDAVNSESSEIYVTAGSGNPAITGIVVSGGYGVPDADNNSCSYLYQWIYRPIRGVWQKISEFTDNGKSSVSQSRASLAADRIVVDRNIQIARVIYSRIDGDVSTQVADTSNVLTIYVDNPIDASDVVVINNGACAGTPIVIKVNEGGVNDYSYVWDTDDANLSIYIPDETASSVRFDNTTDDFVVSLYRKNRTTGSKSATIEIPVHIVSMNPWFSIVVDGIEHRVLDFPDEIFHIQPGARVQLRNETTGCDIYQWTLEMQYHLGMEVQGTTSLCMNPACYLYNAGQNKIMLTARGSEGCTSSVTAENIYVNEGATLRRANSFFVDDEESVESGVIAGYNGDIRVRPTLLSDGNDIVRISGLNSETGYVIHDMSGRVVASGFAASDVEIDCASYPAGVYILNVGDEYFKIIRN